MPSEAEIEAAARALYRLAAAEWPHASPWEKLRKAKGLYVEQARVALEAAEFERHAHTQSSTRSENVRDG